jgi:hypothetical protein
LRENRVRILHIVIGRPAHKILGRLVNHIGRSGVHPILVGCVKRHIVIDSHLTLFTAPARILVIGRKERLVVVVLRHGVAVELTHRPALVVLALHGRTSLGLDGSVGPVGLVRLGLLHELAHVQPLLLYYLH